MVNEELWNEARTYGDIQLMPFVDYYSLILWKTIAICIYGVYLIYCIIFYFIYTALDIMFAFSKQVFFADKCPVSQVCDEN